MKKIKNKSEMGGPVEVVVVVVVVVVAVVVSPMFGVSAKKSLG